MNSLNYFTENGKRKTENGIMGAPLLMLDCCHFLSPNHLFQPPGGLLLPVIPGDAPAITRADPAGFKSSRLHAEKIGTEVVMNTAFEFIRRMQEDPEFREKVNACPDGEARLAFVKSAGYDFGPFVQILDNLSSVSPSTVSLRQPRGTPIPGQTAPRFLGRISRIIRASLSPRLGR